MRVMVLVKATDDSEAGILPSTELIEAISHSTKRWQTPGSCWPVKDSSLHRKAGA